MSLHGQISWRKQLKFQKLQTSAQVNMVIFYWEIFSYYIESYDFAIE